VELSSRADSLQALGEREFDLLVIGGGIIGAGTAAAAAHQGLAVALVDRSDFGAATSSSSSKLIHGGLRYLRLGDVGLVREAHEERRLLMTLVAPHLVHQIPFMMPLYEQGPYRPWVVQSGIALYSTLARARLNGLVEPARARRMVPDLRGEGLRKCGLYVDCWTNDSRLTLANVRAVAEQGGTVVNYAEVAALRLERGAVRGAELLADGATIHVSARAVVNASGPWLDSVRLLEDPTAGRSIRLSKGVHVLLEPASSWSAALTIPHDKVRVSFAVPWQGMVLLGTTDSLWEGDPASVRVEEGEIEQVLAEAAVALDPALVARERVRASYAGLRVLPGGVGSTTSARRETVYNRGTGGMLSVAGGKLTTYRRIALDALEELRSELGLHAIDRRPWPLPGATGLDRMRLPQVEPPLRSHLRQLYGSLAGEVLAPALDDPALLEPLSRGAPDIAAQALYAARSEWARSAEDVLRRRTTLALRGLVDADLIRRVDELIGLRAQPALAGRDRS
jgi:glycerol-3-phosphate dehydrogenase